MYQYSTISPVFCEYVSQQTRSLSTRFPTEGGSGYLNGQYNSAPILHLDTRTHETTTRGHQLKLEKGRSRLDVRKHFFTQRVVNLWKALPVNLVSAPTVNAFKNRLDKLWKDAPFTTDTNAPNIYYTLY